MNLSTINDLSLVAQVIAGAGDRAFGRLVERHQESVRRFFLHQTLGDRMLSDDLAQDTFLRAYRSITHFKRLSSFHTWLMKIAYRVWIDHLRSKEKEDDPPPTPPLDADPAPDLISLDIYTALSQLSDAERTCVTLFYIDDMTGERISQITGLTPATVRSHIHRGRQRLAQFLKQNGYG